MNVDINKEVQREMMSPTEDQGIVKLLASELKLRDAKAREQIKNLMAPSNSDSIMAQNEKEVENNVRQEIAQKMQARVMQERQAQARQRQALAGIAGQRASNMQMAASGGIVGYAEGGFFSGLKKLDEGLKADEAARQAERMARGRRVSDYIPVPGGGSYYLPAKNLIYDIGQGVSGLANLFRGESEEKQPAPFDVEGRVVELLRLREGADAEAKARIDQELSSFDSDTIMAARQRMSQGMQAGGIVGFQEGGMPRFPRLFDFSMFLAERGIDSLAGLSADAVNRLRQEYEALQAREMNRPRGDSVSESQMDNLRGVVKGGLEMLIPEVLSPDERSPGSPGQMAGDRLQDAPGIVESMAETGRGMPRANLGDSPRLEIPKTNLGRSPRGEGIERVVGGIANLVPEGKSDLQRELEAAERRMLNEDILRRNTESRRAERARFRNTDAESAEPTRPNMFDLADAQAEMDILNAAQRRQDEAMRAEASQAQAGVGGLPDFLRGLGNENFFEDLATGLSGELDQARRSLFPKTSEYYDVPEGQLAPYLERLGATFSDLAGIPGRAYDEALGIARPAIEDFSEGVDEFSRGFTGEGPTQRTDVEVAEEIIATAPETTTAASTEDADAAAMKDVPQIANPSLRAAIEATQEGAQDAPAATQESEVAAVELASTVAQNPTPENTSRFESEIQRLMERRESPVRALSSFLTSFSQARGGSMGQNLAIATTAMRAADDALDKQIVELEKLRRADQISERDFGLKERELSAQKGLLEAQAGYYENYRDMQTEIAQIRNESGIRAAQTQVFTSVSNIVRDNLSLYRLQAQSELGARDLLAPEVLEKANELMMRDMRSQYRQALAFFGLPATTMEQVSGGGAGLDDATRQDLQAYASQ